MTLHLTEAEYRAIERLQKPAPITRRKYRNQPTTVDGITFDSKREADRWLHLSILVRSGAITDLRRQVPFALVVNRQLICTYVADFVYVAYGGREVVEDAKGVQTKEYRIKKKLMLAVYGIEIQEV